MCSAALQVASAHVESADHFDDLQARGVHRQFCHQCLHAFKTPRQNLNFHRSEYSLCMDDVRPLTLLSHES